MTGLPVPPRELLLDQRLPLVYDTRRGDEVESWYGAQGVHVVRTVVPALADADVLAFTLGLVSLSPREVDGWDRALEELRLGGHGGFPRIVLLDDFDASVRAAPHPAMQVSFRLFSWALGTGWTGEDSQVTVAHGMTLTS